MVGRGAGRAILLLAFVAAAWVVVGADERLRLGFPAVTAAEQGPNRAAIVVRFSDDTVRTQCVSFSESVISAEDLLARSDFDFELSKEGNVCRIDAVGCPASNCYCQCAKPDCLFWGYFHLASTGWQFSGDVPWLSDVVNGSVEGWSWGAGDFSTGVPPPSITFDQVCTPVAVTSTPAATTTPSATAAPTRPAPPEVTFQADSVRVAAGGCTVLRWLTWNADQVMLDGVRVNAQDQQEVCPTAARRYVLIAANAAGQTTREITVQVESGPGASTPALPAPAETPERTAVPLTGTLTPTLLVLATQAPPASEMMTETPASRAQGTPAVSLTGTATPIARISLLDPTSTPLLYATTPEASAAVTAQPAPQQLFVLALGLLLGAGVLFVIGFRVLRSKARPDR